jgi:UDP-N-acetylmuramoyl-L-alanyl-D-glutamate--2,6-diaminopimelate ligase
MTLTSRRAPLASLAPAVQGEVRGDAGTVVTDVVLDTRKVVPGALFCCVPGSRVDGHDLAGKALDAGAAALCVQRPLDLEAPQLVVATVRDALAPLAAAFFQHPSDRFDLVGVTGTNGKTTTTYMLEAIYRAAGLVPGVLGTVEVRVGDERRPAVHTTPEAPDLQRLLAEMADAGVQAAAMEVSSHGLALHRVDGTRFKAAIFTNLTQDHLDFHADLDDYWLAKRRLFTPAFTPLAVVNLDDPHGRLLASTAGIATVTCGTAADADWRATDVTASLEGTGFRLRSPAGSRPVRLRLAGQFNAVNALGALAAADAIGIDLDTAVAGLEALAGVPGRFERVDAGQPFTVLVDYAHTPDSLDNVLRAARAVTKGQVIVVFGCGGDRDRAKRPLMGEIAGRLADLAVVTSDNPRSEAPEAIVAQVAEGVAAGAGPDGYLVEVDRRAAIRAALAMAGPGDAVLIAGKGHEQGQEFAGGRKVPFDDRQVAAEELRALPGGPAGGVRGTPSGRPGQSSSIETPRTKGPAS